VQLLYIVVIPIPKTNELQMKKPEDVCLVVIRQVYTILPNTHGMLPILYYLRTGGLDPTDIKSIQCVVSCVEDWGTWGLIDCSGLLAHAVFAEVD